jgi:zinc transporter ZupT
MMEGIALGVLTDWPKIIGIFCAISAHKPAEACMFAFALLRNQPSKVQFGFLVTVCACMSPIGVGIGVLLQNATSCQMTGIVESASAGREGGFL